MRNLRLASNSSRCQGFFYFSFGFAFGLCMSKGEKGVVGGRGEEQVLVEDLPAGQELRDCQLELSSIRS